MRFFVGLHIPAHARHFRRCMVSRNRLARRRSDFPVHEWLLDSGAFTSVARDGGYTEAPEAYAEEIDRWSRCGRLLAAVSQDWMCEPFVVARTGKTIGEHQHLTIERYVQVQAAVRSGTYVMPVLQGYEPSSYVAHIRQYGPLLKHGMWVGVGSVCRRNGDPAAIVAVLEAIWHERPDLRLHGFGVKATALAHPAVRGILATADSMAWSFAARRQGRDGNSWREAEVYADRVDRLCRHNDAWAVPQPLWRDTCDFMPGEDER